MPFGFSTESSACASSIKRRVSPVLSRNCTSVAAGAISSANCASERPPATAGSAMA